MEYAEALDIVARSRTQFQAFEKLDEVLRKASAAENYVKELVRQRDDLQSQIHIEESNLNNLHKSNNAAAADFEARLSQLKKAESAAVQRKEQAEAELKKTLADHDRELQKQAHYFDETMTKVRMEVDQELAAKKQELADIEQKISKMKELARSMA